MLGRRATIFGSREADRKVVSLLAVVIKPEILTHFSRFLRYQMESVHIWKETVGMWLALRASTDQLLLPNPVTPLQHQVLKLPKLQVLQKQRLHLQIQL